LHYLLLDPQGEIEVTTSGQLNEFACHRNVAEIQLDSRVVRVLQNEVNIGSVWVNG